MNVLAICAHPDDAEILCGGTLAKYAARGDKITIAISTNGEVGSPTLSKPEISEIRRQEAKAAADLIGADLIWMGYRTSSCSIPKRRVSTLSKRCVRAEPRSC